jgi:uncharacterized protein (DUF58 family)
VPTKRARTFVIVSLLFYFLANQTQVGWLYVISALLLALMPAAWWLNRHMLRRLHAERRIRLNRSGRQEQAAFDSDQPELYEGDEVSIQLTLHNDGRTAAYQIRAAEGCPLTPPGSAELEFNLFIPHLPAHSMVPCIYDIAVVHRRGMYTFPAPVLHTQAPFGFFRRRRKLSIQTRVLVFPECRPVHRLHLFNTHRVTERDRPQAGVGTEVLGVRPYRAGDSPRHIHWRSVARTGQLISKEFADEAQPGLTLMIDLFHYPYPATESKHTPFEWGVKAATTVAEYAHRGGYPIHLVADESALPAPHGPVSWHALMAYLARVQPTGNREPDQFWLERPTQTFVAVVLPWPNRALVSTITELRHRGLAVMAILLEPASFPDKGPTAQPLAGELMANGIDVRFIRFGADWTAQLEGDWELEIGDLENPSISNL